MYINVRRHQGCMPYAVILSGILFMWFAVVINTLTAIIKFYMGPFIRLIFHLKSDLHLKLCYWHYHHNQIIRFCKTSKLYLLNESMSLISVESMGCSIFHWSYVNIYTVPNVSVLTVTQSQYWHIRYCIYIYIWSVTQSQYWHIRYCIYIYIWWLCHWSYVNIYTVPNVSVLRLCHWSYVNIYTVPNVSVLRLCHWSYVNIYTVPNVSVLRLCLWIN